MNRSLWLRWSWRDLRRRWVLVTVIALIIALGTATYAGLGSTAAWRRQTNDASFASLAMHDLRFTLAQGSTASDGQLLALADGIPSAADVVGAEERLVTYSQVDASRPGEAILVPSELVGIDVRDAVTVDRLWAGAGRTLQPGDDGEPVAVLEHQFADLYDLPDTGTVAMSGEATLRYVGVGTTPQHFVVTGRTGSVFAQAAYAVVFVPLSTAQEITGQPGAVNELVLRLRAGADAAAVESEVLAAAATALPDTGITPTRRADEPAVRLLYEDIENDQQFWNTISLLILAGATFASFNLVTRMVESQRREIGIGMALGVPRTRLAVRPLLAAAEIAALGVVAGIALGFALGLWLRQIFSSLLPMPEWRTPFQPGMFARAAVIGFVLPFVASAVPVLRALRVQPVDAIRTGHLTARTGRVGRLVSRLPMPGRTYQQMPVRNVVRTPRRTLLTALAIGAAITAMVATIGIVDTFVRTLDVGEAELGGDAPDRLSVELDSFYPVDAPEVTALADSSLVATAEPRLRLFGTIASGDVSIDVLVDLVDFDRASWTPTLLEGGIDAVEAGGLVLSRKAVDDLGLDVGDALTFRHPERVGLGYRLVTSSVPIAGVDPNPVRNLAYLDLGQASLFELEGITNVVDVHPAAGTSEDEVKRALFGTPGVASVEGVTATIRLFRDALASFFGILRVAEAIVLLLALLIAFNSTSISIDERAREHATMLAFGLPPRVVLAMVTVESVITGLVGTALGVLAGRGVLQWMTAVQLDDTMPDLGVVAFVSTGTIATAFLLGVVAVGAAPLLASRRVRHVDIPSTLRVLE